MPTISNIIGVIISLDIGGDRALFILLARDGSINRLGTGTIRNEDIDLFIGSGEEAIFEQLMSHLKEETLNHMGGYDIPEKRGKLCKLTILFRYSDEKEKGFVFQYGSNSLRPPLEIAQFVTAAVKLTDPWYEEQKRMVSQS